MAEELQALADGAGHHFGRGRRVKALPSHKEAGQASRSARGKLPAD